MAASASDSEISKAIVANMDFESMLQELTEDFTSEAQFKELFQALKDKINELEKEFKKSEYKKLIKNLQPNDKWLVFPFDIDISGPEFDHIEKHPMIVYAHMEAKGRYMDYSGFVEIIDPEWESFEEHWIDDGLYIQGFKRFEFVGGQKAFAPSDEQIEAAGGLEWEQNEDHKDPGYNACMKLNVYAYHRKIPIDVKNLYLACDYEHEELKWFKIVETFDSEKQQPVLHSCVQLDDGSFSEPLLKNQCWFCDDDRLTPMEFEIFGVKPNPDYEGTEPDAKIARTE